MIFSSTHFDGQHGVSILNRQARKCRRGWALHDATETTSVSGFGGGGKVSLSGGLAVAGVGSMLAADGWLTLVGPMKLWVPHVSATDVSAIADSD